MTPACVASRPEEEAAGSVPSSLKGAGEQSDLRLSALQATRLLGRILGAPRPPGVGLSAALRSSQGMAMGVPPRGPSLPSSRLPDPSDPLGLPRGHCGHGHGGCPDWDLLPRMRLTEFGSGGPLNVPAGAVNSTQPHVHGGLEGPRLGQALRPPLRSWRPRPSAGL